MVAKKTEFDIADIIDNEEDESEDIYVTGPSGSTYQVYNDLEAEHYKQLSERYQEDNVFANVSDIQELDRIIMMELMAYRWGSWLLQEKDYEGKRVNPQELQKSIAAYSKEIREIKKDLGMDKSTRDRDQGENLAAYVENLRVRAKEFGIVRNEQAIKAINILMELRGHLTLWKNSSESERREFNANLEDIVAWCETKFDEFDEIDAALREKQKYWIHEIAKG